MEIGVLGKQDICTNQVVVRANDTFDVTAQCVANWYLTGDQLLVSTYALASLVVLASLWVLAAKIAAGSTKGVYTFSRAIRIWAQQSRFAIIMNRPVQLFVSFCILITFVVRLATYTVTAASYHILTGLYCISFVDDVIRFFASRYKLKYVFSPYVILETICICSHFVLGYGSSRIINGVPSRTWLDFSVLRSIFIYRSFTEMEQHINRRSKGYMLFRLWTKSMLLVFFAAGVMFLLETLGELPFFEHNGFAHIYQCNDGSLTQVQSENCSDETWSVMFSFYFTVVTLTTVGYGDIAPQTVLARLLVIIFIVAGIIKFSMEIENWVNIYRLRNIGNPPFAPLQHMNHVVLMGNPSFVQLDSTLRELTHEDHFTSSEGGVCTLHAVVLGERSSKFTKGLVLKLKKNSESSRYITYVAGNPIHASDLDRASIKSAVCAFFLPNKTAQNPNEEDYRTILSLLSTKRHAGHSFRCLVMLLRAENTRHVLAAGVHRDDIICEDTVKMGVLAQSSQSPGCSTMISNIAACLSLAKNGDEEQEENLTRIQQLKKNIKQKTTRSIETKIETPRSNPWTYKKEYLEGASRELYVVVLSRAYLDMTFSAAAVKAFNESSGTVVLVACEVGLESIVTSSDVDQDMTHGTRVLLNPGHSLRIVSNMRIYVLADDVESVVRYGISDPVHHEQAPIVGLSESGSETTTTAAAAAAALRSPTTTPHDEDTCVTKYVAAMTPSRKASTPAAPESVSFYGEDGMTDVVFSGRRPIVTLDSPLARVAFHYRKQKDSPSLASIYQMEDDGEMVDIYAQPLRPPPISVLRDPTHIVVCSFLGASALTSLQYFIGPLRGVFSIKQPPVTILDMAEPSTEWTGVLSKFEKVYHVRGSPLVYADLQRAGAKAAAAVVILAKKASAFSLGQSESTVDAEAIFTTLLVELKMEVDRIFCITELADQSNSHFLGDRRVACASGSGITRLETIRKERKFWNAALRAFPLVDDGPSGIYTLPRYMAGRLFHDQLCENLLVQSFFNPNIHRIIRQLIGGPRSTGYLMMYRLPKHIRQEMQHGAVTYEKLFTFFCQSHHAGICIGLYRHPCERRFGANGPVLFPTVLTGPPRTFILRPNDGVYVLVGWHTIEKSARSIQAVYRGHRARRTWSPHHT